jgi:hypothetical protein
MTETYASHDASEIEQKINRDQEGCRFVQWLVLDMSSWQHAGKGTSSELFDTERECYRWASHAQKDDMESNGGFLKLGVETCLLLFLCGI